ncbi:MAG: hypothetical protein ACI9KK_002584 [Ascidiaceihabitans sp.]|jgi:hypothetical protein
MPDAHSFRIIGLCILAAFPLFGVGQALLGSEWHWLGLIMCLSNAVAVITIGLLMRPIIATTAPRRHLSLGAYKQLSVVPSKISWTFGSNDLE